MDVYTLTELGDPEAIDLFMREDALGGTRGCARERARLGWHVSVEPVELDERDVSANDAWLEPQSCTPARSRRL